MLFLHLRARQWLSSYMRFEGLQVMQSEIAHVRFLGMVDVSVVPKRIMCFCNDRTLILKKISLYS